MQAEIHRQDFSFNKPLFLLNILKYYKALDKFSIRAIILVIISHL